MKVTMTLEGVNRVKNAFRRMPEVAKRHCGQAVRETTRAVAQGAKMRAPVSSGGRSSRKGKMRQGPGELRDTIRDEYVEDAKGVVGFVKAGYGKFRRRLKGKATNKRTKAAKAKRKARPKSKVAGETSKFFSQFFTAENQRSHAERNDLGAYGPLLEYGDPRRGRPAQPYMRPALESQRQPHQQRVARALQATCTEVEREMERTG